MSSNNIPNETETIARLKAQLAHKDKALRLVKAIDKIRDQHQEPVQMLSALVNLLADQFNTALCLLALVDPESGNVELKAVQRQQKTNSNVNQLIHRDLVAKAVYLPSVTVLDQSDLEGEFDLPQDMHIVAVPIALEKDKPLGALLLARPKKAFTPEDIGLLTLAEEHIDSAVVQGHAYNELQHRYKELDLIYRIDRIRDHHLPLDEMLNEILQIVQHAIPSEIGFAMLYDQTGKRLGMRAATREDLFHLSPYTQKIEAYAYKALEDAEIMRLNDLTVNGLRSMMCLPLILNERIIGALGVLNRYNQRGFTHQDEQLLSAIGSQMDTAIYESLEQRHLRDVLGRSVDPRIMEHILSSDKDVLKTERMFLSVLYADLRGSTSLAERTEPDVLINFINDYLYAMTDVVFEHRATLDKFVGDEVMALFGAPFPMADHALCAIRAGLDMQKAHLEVMAKWEPTGIVPTPVGIGIATGDLIAGEVGSKERADYTVMGKAANLGARICSAAQGGQLLVCDETYRLVEGRVKSRPIHGMQFKGVDKDMIVYEIFEVL